MNAEPTPVLELAGVSKVYGEGASEVHALRGVDLTVAAGELVAVMGPSGSGKSSLLTIAGSLERPTTGAVRVDGQELTGRSGDERAALRRRSIGYVFQEFNLLPGLTAAENVAMPLELDGVPARTARTQALDALDQLGVADRADHVPDDLSGGERQRVAIARAIIGERRLVLIAELGTQPESRTPVGFVCAERQPGSRWGALLDNLHALPAHQGIGVGKRLMEAAQTWARAQGEAQLYLYVLDGNASAIAFYERQGWEYSGAEPDHMGGIDITALRYVFRLDAAK